MSGIIGIIICVMVLSWASKVVNDLRNGSQERVIIEQDNDLAQEVLDFKAEIQQLDADLAVFEALPDDDYREQASEFTIRLIGLSFRLNYLEDVLEPQTYQQLSYKIDSKYDEIRAREKFLREQAEQEFFDNLGRIFTTPHQAELEELQGKINQVNEDIVRGNHLLSQGKADECLVLFKMVSRKLDQILEQAERMEDIIDEELYDELLAQVHASQEDVAETLERLDDEVDEAELERFAPEIFDTVHSIQLSNASIIKKITKSDSSEKEELLALHDTHMRQFSDILSGYLKIKRSPTDYYDAEEKLAKAKQALESLDQGLLENIRQLNENDLAEFKISLRMVGKWDKAR